MTKHAIPEWSPMRAADIDDVAQLGNAVHVDYPEDVAVFRNHYEIFPQGCLILRGAGGDIGGYAMSHPWRAGMLPELNRAHEIPADADCLHLHDIVVTPDMRGHGLAGRAVELFAQLARGAGYGSLSLVAVSGTHVLWSRSGFSVYEDERAQASCRAFYSENARYMLRAL